MAGEDDVVLHAQLPSLALKLAKELPIADDEERDVFHGIQHLSCRPQEVRESFGGVEPSDGRD